MLAHSCADCDNSPDKLCDACKAAKERQSMRPLIETLDGAALQDYIDTLLSGSPADTSLSQSPRPGLASGSAEVQNLRGNGMLAKLPGKG